MSCVIEGCKSHTGRKEIITQETVTFHRFPKNEHMKNIWIQCVRRANWTWNKRSHICSKHFTLDSFVPNTNLKWRRLKANAFPSLYLPDSIKLERPDAMDIAESHQNVTIDVETKLPLSRIKQLSTTSAETTCCRHEAIILGLKRQLARTKMVSQQRLRKINTLTKRISRLSKKTDDLNSILIDRVKKENIEYTLLDTINKNANKINDSDSE